MQKPSILSFNLQLPALCSNIFRCVYVHKNTLLVFLCRSWTKNMCSDGGFVGCLWVFLCAWVSTFCTLLAQESLMVSQLIDIMASDFLKIHSALSGSCRSMPRLMLNSVCIALQMWEEITLKSARRKCWLILLVLLPWWHSDCTLYPAEDLGPQNRPGDVYTAILQQGQSLTFSSTSLFHPNQLYWAPECCQCLG